MSVTPMPPQRLIEPRDMRDYSSGWEVGLEDLIEAQDDPFAGGFDLEEAGAFSCSGKRWATIFPHQWTNITAATFQVWVYGGAVGKQGWAMLATQDLSFPTVMDVQLDQRWAQLIVVVSDLTNDPGPALGWSILLA